MISTANKGRNYAVSRGTKFALVHLAGDSLGGNEMNIETAKSFFLWCTIINYCVLLIWCGVFLFAHDLHYGLAKRFFRNASVEQYDGVNFFGIAFYKLSIILFNLVPYAALCIISR